MPFDMTLKAKTTDDGRCGLHCFVPTVEKILLNPDGTHDVEKEELAKQFCAYYQIENKVGADAASNFNGDKLSHLLRDLDPKEKEALLEPVLRKMMIESMDAHWVSSSSVDIANYQERRKVMMKANSHLHSNELAYLAYTLGINLESYEARVSMLPRLLTLNRNPYELKIRRDKKQWEFEMNCAKDVKEKKELVDEHNAYFQANSRKFHTENLARALRSQVKQAVANKQSLKGIYLQPGVMDSSMHSGDALLTSTAAPSSSNFGRISAMIDNFIRSMIGDTIGLGKKEDMFSGLLKIFANIFKAVLGIMDLGTQIGKMNNHEVSPAQLDSLQAEEREETLNFMDGTKQLASAGGSAQLLANSLNKEWSKDIEAGDLKNRDALWLKLIEGLKRQDKTEEALGLLKQREEALLRKLINPEAAKENDPKSIARHGSAGAAAAPAPGSQADAESKRIAESFQAVLNELDSLKNVNELRQASHSTQKACLDTRVDLFRKAIQSKSTDGSLTKLFNNFRADFNKIILDCEKSRIAKENAGLSAKAIP